MYPIKKCELHQKILQAQDIPEQDCGTAREADPRSQALPPAQHPPPPRLWFVSASSHKVFHQTFQELNFSSRAFTEKLEVSSKFSTKCKQNVRTRSQSNCRPQALSLPDPGRADSPEREQGRPAQVASAPSCHVGFIPEVCGLISLLNSSTFGQPQLLL